MIGGAKVNNIWAQKAKSGGGARKRHRFINEAKTKNGFGRNKTVFLELTLQFFSLFPTFLSTFGTFRRFLEYIERECCHTNDFGRIFI